MTDRTLSDNARSAIVNDIRDYLQDILVRYYTCSCKKHKGCTKYSGLLAILDAIGCNSVLPTDTAGGRSGKPGSRQPPAACVDWAARIRKELARWDQLLRWSQNRDSLPDERPADVAMRALQSNAHLANDELLLELRKELKIHHSTAAVLCGFVDAERDLPHHYPQAACMQCGQCEIWGVASSRTGECRACGEVYDPARLFNLMKAA